MNGRLQKHIHPGKAAALVLIVLAVVQAVWWRGLVYRPPGKAPIGGGGAVQAPPKQVVLTGRSDVVVETFSGDLAPGDSDGPGHATRFDRPTGLALATDGSLYVADTGNSRIRRISPDGMCETIAGSDSGFADGPARQARFNAPCGVCVGPDGAVYVADTGNGCIRKILGGQVSTIAGDPRSPSGPKLLLPTGIAFTVLPTPAILVACSGENRLRRFHPDGSPDSDQTTPGPPISVTGGPVPAVSIPQTSTLIINSQTVSRVPVQGGETMPNGERRPVLRHPVGMCALGDGFLLTDVDNGAVFRLRAGEAEVLAGYVSSGGPNRGSQDGEGDHCRFSVLSGIVTDGKRYAYIADTANNMIRRMDISRIVGSQADAGRLRMAGASASAH